MYRAREEGGCKRDSRSQASEELHQHGHLLLLGTHEFSKLVLLPLLYGGQGCHHLCELLEVAMELCVRWRGR